MGVTDQGRDQDLSMHMEWAISRSSGIVQLAKLLPLDTVYPESHGSGQIGPTWAAHHRAFAQFIHKFSPSSIFEIGGGHGILSREYNSLTTGPQRPRWLILEPNPTPVNGVQAEYIQGFFDDHFVNQARSQRGLRFQMVLHSHLFEHTYHPRDFLSHLQHFIEPTGIMAFSVPNLPVMLEKKYCNALNFEHTFFYDEQSIESLLSNYGFKILEKEYFREDHSIFFAAVRSNHSGLNCPQDPKSDFNANLQMFNSFIDHHRSEVAHLNTNLLNCNIPVYLFGAHIFSQYLLQFGLNEQRIEAILDNDRNKHGKRLYGSGLRVSSPTLLKDVGKCAVILRAGAYSNEIRHDILTRINPDVCFW